MLRTRSRSLFTDYLPHDNTISPNISQRERSKLSPTSSSPVLQAFKRTTSPMEEDAGNNESKSLTISQREPTSPYTPPSFTSNNDTPHSPSSSSPAMVTPRRRKLSLTLQNINSPLCTSINSSSPSNGACSGQGTPQSGSSSPTNSASPPSLSSSPSNCLFINDATSSTSSPRNSPRRSSLKPSGSFVSSPVCASTLSGNSRRNSVERKTSEAFIFPNINEKPMNNRLREIKSMEFDEQLDYSLSNSSPSLENTNDSLTTTPNDIGLSNYFLQPTVPTQLPLVRKKSLLRRNSSSSIVGDHEIPSLIPSFQRKESVGGDSFRNFQRIPSKSSFLNSNTINIRNEEETTQPKTCILSTDERKGETSPKIITTPSTHPKSKLESSSLNESKPNQECIKSQREGNSSSKSLLSMEMSSELLTSEQTNLESQRRRNEDFNEESHRDSSFDRLVSNFSSIQKHKKDLKKIPDFEEHMKEFSFLVRQFQTKGVVLNQQEIEEFLRDDRKEGDEVHDVNILSKTRSRELEEYIKTLGPKTVHMMCEWRDRFHSFHDNSNAVLDFSDKKKKVEENMKLMKEALASVTIPITNNARRDSISALGNGGRTNSLPNISTSPTASPQTINNGLTMFTASKGTPIGQTRGIRQSKSSIMLSPSTSSCPTPKARQRSKSFSVIKKLD